MDVQNITTWVLAGLKSSTTYTISVRARTVAGFGDDSVSLTVSTLESGMVNVLYIGSAGTMYTI